MKKNQEKETKFKLKSLTPVNDLYVSDLREYKNTRSALDNAIKTEGVYNVALTGKYGSGKSSIINSYLNDPNSEIDVKKVFKIGLAKFSEKQSSSDKKQWQNDNGSNQDDKVKRRTIENSTQEPDSGLFADIINQLVYQLPSWRIPLTRFKKKEPISFTFRIILILVMLFVLSLYLQLPFTLSAFFKQIRFYGIIFGSVYIVRYFLLKTDFQKLKLSFKNSEATLDLAPDELFEKNTDELIYLFNKSRKRILIIEDLDRCSDLSVFVRLRELNVKLNLQNDKLLNRILKIIGFQREKEFVFIYLLADDIFENKLNRVKFFDQIIPVIPYITSQNAAEKLGEELEDDSLNNALIRLIGRKVSDYRILIDIVNEYKLYLAAFPKTDKNQLLGLIAYKVMEPHLFYKLQNGEGPLAEILDSFWDEVVQQKNIHNDNLLKLKQKKEKEIFEYKANYLLEQSQQKNIEYQYGAYYTSINSLDIARKVVDTNSKIMFSGQEGIPVSDYLNKTIDLSKSDQITEISSDISDEEKIIRGLKIPELRNLIKEEWKNKLGDYLYKLIQLGVLKTNYNNVINNFHGEKSTQIFIDNLNYYHDDLRAMPLDDYQELFANIPEWSYENPAILNYGFTTWLSQNHKMEFSKVIKLAAKQNDYFIEDLINRKSELFELIVRNVPSYKFDLKKLIVTHVTEIICANRYEPTLENFKELVEWAKLKYTTKQEYLDLVNNNSVNIEFLKELISSKPKYLKDTIFSDYKNDELWNYVLFYNLIVPSASNVNEYLVNHSWSEVLLEFMSSSDFAVDEPINHDKAIQALSLENINQEILNKLFDKGKRLTPNELEGVNAKYIQFLFGLELVDVSEGIVEIIEDNKVDLPNSYRTAALKEFYIENQNVQVRDKTVEDLLGVDSDNNKELFFKYLGQLSLETVLNSKLLSDKLRGKIYKVVNKSTNSQNLNFENNDVNKSILQWLADKKIIRDFYQIKNGKWKITLMK